MTLYAIANHNGCNFAAAEKTQFPAFNGQEYCGHIHLIAAWQVPDRIYEELRLPKHLPLYLTSEGQWASALEIAEHLLITEAPPKEFFVKGASLGLFVPGTEENGSPNTYSDYRVFQRSAGYWDAEEIEELPQLVGAFEEF